MNEIKMIRHLISEDKLTEAIHRFLLLSTTAPEFHRSVLLQKSPYTRLEKECTNGVIARQEAEAKRVRISDSVLQLLAKWEKEFTPATVFTSSNPGEPTSIANEKILGINNIRQFAWLARAIAASRAVYRIMVELPNGGRTYGTGFLIAPDVLTTNNHVTNSAASAGRAVIEFNYQLAFQGSEQSSTRYYLDPSQFYTKESVDYSLVKMLPDTSKPSLYFWGESVPEHWRRSIALRTRDNHPTSQWRLI